MARKILIVDDDRLNTTLIRFTLKEMGYDVVSADDGRSGIQAMSAERPDLIVLDIQMPGMSGFEFMNELKTMPQGAAIPVIMLTANETLQDVFFSEGVKGYLVKPVDPKVLEAKIRGCLGSG
ncbi:MAG: response regulator [Elusimicrobia bacterium]|nr:response regulator [Elusimicrobiota bacterium]